MRACKNILALLAVSVVVLSGTDRHIAYAADSLSEGAETQSVAKSPLVTKPVPQLVSVKAPPADYPYGIVEVLLTINTSGLVERSAAGSGPPILVQWVLEQVSEWVFVPASVNGVPKAAEIRYQVRFEETPDEFTPEGSSINEDSSETTPDEELIAAEEPEIIVHARDKALAGVVRVTRQEARDTPGAFGDPFRTVESMPGVGAVVSGLPYFYIRGAPPGNTGYFVDGVRVPLLYHLFLGPSVVHPAFIDHVDLHAGYAPSAMGQFAGGMIDAKLRGSATEFRAEANVRTFDAGAFIETPFADGRGTAQVGGRYSYTAALLSSFSPVSLDYWDYQSKVSYRIGERDELSVFFFGARDATSDPISGRDVDTTFHRVDLRWYRQIDGTSHLKSAVTIGADKTGGSTGFVSDKLVHTRLHYEKSITPEVSFNTGFRTYFDSYELEIDPRQVDGGRIAEQFPTRIDQSLAGYVEVNWRPHPLILITSGLRTDYYYSMSASAVSVQPRLAMSFQLAPRLETFVRTGLTSQPPNYVPSIPGAQVGGLPGGLQELWASDAGARYKIDQVWDVSTSIFQNAFFNLADPFGITQELNQIGNESSKVRMLGESYGLELSLKKRLEKNWSLWVNYTLSRSTRAYETIETVAGFDRTHIFNIAAAYEFGEGWRSSIRFLVYSGVPGSRPTKDGKVFDQSRSAPFYRIDWKLEKRIAVGERSALNIYAEMLNASLSQEVTRRSCVAECIDYSQPPIFLPSLGVEYLY